MRVASKITRIGKCRNLSYTNSTGSAANKFTMGTFCGFFLSPWLLVVYFSHSRFTSVAFRGNGSLKKQGTQTVDPFISSTSSPSLSQIDILNLPFRTQTLLFWTFFSVGSYMGSVQTSGISLGFVFFCGIVAFPYFPSLRVWLTCVCAMSASARPMEKVDGRV
ncbi:unnamed protein product [Periconia digitata]|uniref:Uncharacterized protein n=1 Tax=Periconia digitata TaxID=1303443 RepID=A0A9W4U3M6_9PLEO|nr:unnamed protein product [Periconia digitata]